MVSRQCLIAEAIVSPQMAQGQQLLRIVVKRRASRQEALGTIGARVKPNLLQQSLERRASEGHLFRGLGYIAVITAKTCFQVMAGELLDGLFSRRMES